MGIATQEQSLLKVNIKEQFWGRFCGVYNVFGWVHGKERFWGIWIRHGQMGPAWVGHLGQQGRVEPNGCSCAVSLSDYELKVHLLRSHTQIESHQQIRIINLPDLFSYWLFPTAEFTIK